MGVTLGRLLLVEAPVSYQYRGDDNSTVNILGVVGRLGWGIVEHLINASYCHYQQGEAASLYSLC